MRCCPISSSNNKSKGYTTKFILNNKNNTNSDSIQYRDSKRTSLVHTALTGTFDAVDSVYGDTLRAADVRTCMRQGYVNHWLMKEKKGNKVKRVKVGCSSRLCSHCAEVRKRDLRERLKEIVLTYKDPRFLTIGFKNVGELEKAHIKRCAADFNYMLKLLKSRNKTRQKAGKQPYTLGRYINVMEIEHSKEKGYNIHYHILYDGTFIPQKLLVSLFKKATQGESYYVYIKAMPRNVSVRDRIKALYYITKYISKSDTSRYPAHVAIQIIKGTKRCRFVKVVGDPLPKIEATHTPLRHFLTITPLTSLDSRDAKEEFLARLDMKMQDFGAREWDLELHDTENFFLYAAKQIKDGFYEHLIEVSEW